MWYVYLTPTDAAGGGESGRGTSRRGAHHAPEYLERRKADRERRRSADTVMTSSRLRLRRSSRARKVKDEEVS